MNRGTVRQGFALITAVIISAAILATIVGIATLTLRETRVQAEQNASDQALVVAERGLADVVSQFRANQTLATTVIGLGNNGVWELLPSSGTVSPGGHAFYWVKVVAQVPQGTHRDYAIYAAGFIVRPDVRPPFSTDLKTLAVSTTTTDVIARRVVQVTGTMSSSGPSAFDYGLFTGVNFEMSGSKNLADLTTVTTAGTSGIYAAGNIAPISGSGTFTDLQLYAEHDIDKDVADMLLGSSESHPGYNVSPKPTFPSLDLEKYMDLFDAFVAGTTPFDGSKPDYPDLSNDLVRSAVLAALGHPENNNVIVNGQAHHFVKQDNLNWLSNYTAKVVSLSLPGLNPDQEAALKSTLSKSVFYVRTDAGNPDVTWQSNREYLAGVIVSSGNIKFTGCPDFAQGQVAAFLAHGTIDLAGSTSGDTPARGIFYAEGWDASKGKYVDKAVLYTGSGWFEGQVISKSTVDWAGSGNIKFTDYSKEFGSLLPGTVVNGFSQNPSGWTEKAWLDFLNLPAR